MDIREFIEINERLSTNEEWKRILNEVERQRQIELLNSIQIVDPFEVKARQPNFWERLWNSVSSVFRTQQQEIKPSPTIEGTAKPIETKPTIEISPEDLQKIKKSIELKFNTYLNATSSPENIKNQLQIVSTPIMLSEEEKIPLGALNQMVSNTLDKVALPIYLGFTQSFAGRQLTRLLDKLQGTKLEEFNEEEIKELLSSRSFIKKLGYSTGHFAGFLGELWVGSKILEATRVVPFITNIAGKVLNIQKPIPNAFLRKFLTSGKTWEDAIEQFLNLYGAFATTRLLETPFMAISEKERPLIKEHLKEIITHDLPMSLLLYAGAGMNLLTKSIKDGAIFGTLTYLNTKDWQMALADTIVGGLMLNLGYLNPQALREAYLRVMEKMGVARERAMKYLEDKPYSNLFYRISDTQKKDIEMRGFFEVGQGFDRVFSDPVQKKLNLLFEYEGKWQKESITLNNQLKEIFNKTMSKSPEKIFPNIEVGIYEAEGIKNVSQSLGSYTVLYKDINLPEIQNILRDLSIVGQSLFKQNSVLSWVKTKEEPIDLSNLDSLDVLLDTKTIKSLSRVRGLEDLGEGTFGIFIDLNRQLTSKEIKDISKIALETDAGFTIQNATGRPEISLIKVNLWDNRDVKEFSQSIKSFLTKLQDYGREQKRRITIQNPRVEYGRAIALGEGGHIGYEVYSQNLFPLLPKQTEKELIQQLVREFEKKTEEQKTLSQEIPDVIKKIGDDFIEKSFRDTEEKYLIPALKLKDITIGDILDKNSPEKINDLVGKYYLKEGYGIDSDSLAKETPTKKEKTFEDELAVLVANALDIKPTDKNIEIVKRVFDLNKILDEDTGIKYADVVLAKLISGERDYTIPINQTNLQTSKEKFNKTREAILNDLGFVSEAIKEYIPTNIEDLSIILATSDSIIKRVSEINPKLGNELKANREQILINKTKANDLANKIIQTLSRGTVKDIQELWNRLLQEPKFKEYLDTVNIKLLIHHIAGTEAVIKETSKRVFNRVAREEVRKEVKNSSTGDWRILGEDGSVIAFKEDGKLIQPEPIFKDLWDYFEIKAFRKIKFPLGAPRKGMVGGNIGDLVFLKSKNPITLLEETIHYVFKDAGINNKEFLEFLRKTMKYDKETIDLLLKEIEWLNNWGYKFLNKDYYAYIARGQNLIEAIPDYFSYAVVDGVDKAVSRFPVMTGFAKHFLGEDRYNFLINRVQLLHNWYNATLLEKLDVMVNLDREQQTRELIKDASTREKFIRGINKLRSWVSDAYKNAVNVFSTLERDPVYDMFTKQYPMADLKYRPSNVMGFSRFILEYGVPRNPDIVFLYIKNPAEAIKRAKENPQDFVRLKDLLPKLQDEEFVSGFRKYLLARELLERKKANPDAKLPVEIENVDEIAEVVKDLERSNPEYKEIAENLIAKTYEAFLTLRYHIGDYKAQQLKEVLVESEKKDLENYLKMLGISQHNADIVINNIEKIRLADQVLDTEELNGIVKKILNEMGYKDAAINFDYEKVEKLKFAKLVRGKFGEIFVDDMFLSDRALAYYYRFHGSERTDVRDPIETFLRYISYNIDEVYKYATFGSLVEFMLINNVDNFGKGSIILQPVEAIPKTKTSFKEIESKIISQIRKNAKKDGRDELEIEVIVGKAKYLLSSIKDLLGEGYFDIFRPIVKENQFALRDFKTRKYFVINFEPELMSAIKGTGLVVKSRMFENILKVFGFLPQITKKLATAYNIYFSARNILRDAMGSILTPGGGIIPMGALVDGLSVVRKAAMGDQTARKILEITDFLGIHEGTFTKELMETYTSLKDRLEFRGSRKNVLQKLEEVLSFLPQNSEFLARLGNFVRELKRSGMTLDEALEHPDVISLALRSAHERTFYWPTRGSLDTSFGKAVAILDRLSAFFKAKLIATTDTLRRMFGYDPVSREYTVRNAIGVAIKGVSFGFLLSIILDYLNRQNPDYQNLPDYRKLAYFSIPVGGDRFVSIPIPHPYIIVGNFLSHSLWIDKIAKPNTKDLLNAVSKAVEMVDGHSWLSNLTPDVLERLIELQTNYSFWMRREIESAYYRIFDIPEEERYSQSTTNIAKYFANAINDIFRDMGSSYRISPIKADYLLQQIFSGIYEYASTIEAITRQMLGNQEVEPLRFSSVAGLRSIIREFYDPMIWSSTDNFFNITNQYRKLYQEYVKLFNTDPEKAKNFFEKYGDKISKYSIFVYPYEKALESYFQSYRNIDKNDYLLFSDKERMKETIKEGVLETLKSFFEVWETENKLK